MVAGTAYRAFSYAQGASVEYQTGFKSAYDYRCKDTSSEFFKENPWCQEYLDQDIKKYDEILEQDILDDKAIAEGKVLIKIK